jgi:hypothetical protein
MEALGDSERSESGEVRAQDGAHQLGREELQQSKKGEQRCTSHQRKSLGVLLADGLRWACRGPRAHASGYCGGSAGEHHLEGNCFSDKQRQDERERKGGVCAPAGAHGERVAEAPA